MTTILVTGASGFIGMALTSRLLREGYNVVEMSSKTGDIADARVWASMPPASVVVHLAGMCFVPDSWSNSPEFLRVNVVGTEQALNYCRCHGARLVLSSTYVYGLPDRLPINEQHPARPNTPYALSKRMAESLCEFAAMNYGVTTTILRLFNVFGIGQRPIFLIPAILQQVKARDKILVKELTSKRDYVYIDDVVGAFVKACALEGGKCRIFNIASGHAHSVENVIAIVQKVARTNLQVVSENAHRFQEIPEVIADIGFAKRRLGWEPEWTLQDGIEAMVNLSGKFSR